MDRVFVWRFAASLVVAALLGGALPTRTAQADSSFQALPFAQNWANTGLITANDDWAGVPGITGYLGDDPSTTDAPVNPQATLTANATVDVIANQTNPNGNSSGGVAEFELTNPVIALQGSSTADAPFVLISLNTTGQQNIAVSYNLRDIDGSVDNAIQAVALQYRIGTSGNFTNVSAGFVADATTGPSLATLVTPVNVTLPAAADNQAQLQVRVITANAVGSDEWVGVDDISVTGTPLVGGNAPIAPTCPATLNTTPGTAISSAITASDPDGIVTSASITSAAVAGITLDTVLPANAVGGTLNAILTAAATTAAGTYSVVITFANNDATPQTATCTVVVTVQAPSALTTIPTIQGSGLASPLVGQVVTTRGIVTRLYPDGGTPNSLFIQDAGDGNPATSDGVYIFNNAAIPASIAVGDQVQVKGTVTEFNGLTELTTITELTEVPVEIAITPAPLTLPVATADGLEAYENMLVTIPQTMTVSQNYFQGRYGQLTLSANGRLRQPTNIFRPNTPEAIAEAEGNIRRTLILDDGRTSQNPNPIPFMGADNTLRAGDTTAGLTGVIDFGPINANTPATRFYRLQPTTPLATITFARANPRGKPEAVGGNVKVASANVLNYFTTLDASGNKCYSSTGPTDCRGANSAAELDRQRTKIITELLTLDADVVGLMEIENNGPVAVSDLVAGLNAIAGAGTYAVVTDPTNDPITDTTRLGGDAIKVAMIYKPGRVTPQGQALSSPDPVFSRAPFAQAFTLNSTGTVFSVIVNHFKSKGSCPASASDPNGDKGDGQSCWNALRVQQAQALLTLISTVKAAAGSDDVVVIGDLNSYGKEDPIQALTDGSLVNQLAKRIVNPYSYVFDGLAGYLDHALTTASLDAKVTGVTEWHNNADEPSVIDYNTEFKPQDLYAPNPYRATDHDPVLIGFNLGASTQRVYLPLISQ